MTDGLDLQKLLKVVGDLQSNARQLEERLAREQVVGESGGGMVKVEMNGLEQVRKVTIDPSLVKEGDVAMLEDLVAAAVNRATEACKRRAQETAAQASMDLATLFKPGAKE